MSSAAVKSSKTGDATAILSAGDHIEQIAGAFSLTPDMTDIHGPDDLRVQLLTSYVEWLEMERRLATSELWPSLPENYVLIPCNTRWGDWHFGGGRWPDKDWSERPHPLTRAALVLWAVGAIDDIPDPLEAALLKIEAATDSVNAASDDAGAQHAADHCFTLVRRLAEETPAPTTMKGAADGLRFVLKGYEIGESAADVPIVKSVIAFLEREMPPLAEGERRDPLPVKADNALSMIEWQADAWRKWNSFPVNTPDNDRKFEEASYLENNCWTKLIETPATTLPGLKAWVDYLSQPDFVRRIDEAGGVKTVMATLAKSVAFLDAEAARA